LTKRASVISRVEPPLPSDEFTALVSTHEEKLLACIHCGLCLEACPTYVITGDENDGPRGRLYLMRAVAEGRLENTSNAFSKHIDRCLGCRACEQVCPAGVEYGQLLEASREELMTAQPKQDLSNKLLQFVLRYVWPFPKRLRFMFAATRMFRDLGLAGLLLKCRLPRLVSSRAEFALALLVSSRRQVSARGGANSSSSSQATGPDRSVFLFSGCVGEGLFARVNKATERVLAANGFASVRPSTQVCCGALHAHAGDLEGARTLARQNIEAFGNQDNRPIVTNAGGCGAMLASYGHLLEGDEESSGSARAFSERIVDIGQQLQTIDIRRGSTIAKNRVTYDTSCHLLYGQRAGEASLRMLAAIPDLNFATLEGAERCCGGAGIYNLLEPEMSGRVLEEKLSQIKQTGATVLATGNPGCQMQIGAGASLAKMNLRVCHPVELLDISYAQAGFYREGDDEQDKT
jgi:glycolate oxidase iron-sulfur subunit